MRNGVFKAATDARLNRLAASAVAKLAVQEDSIPVAQVRSSNDAGTPMDIPVPPVRRMKRRKPKVFSEYGLSAREMKF